MEIQISFAVLIAIVVGLIQIAKGLKLPAKFSPLLALVLGVSLSFIVRGILNVEWTVSIIQGLVIGLTSVGLYSSIKNTVGK